MFKGLRDKFFRMSDEAKAKSIEDISAVIDESGRKLKEDVLDELLHELELGLLEADVALPVAEELSRKVRKQLVGRRVDRSFQIDDAGRLALRSAVKDVLTEQKLSLNELIKAK